MHLFAKIFQAHKNKEPPPQQGCFNWLCSPKTHKQPIDSQSDLPKNRHPSSASLSVCSKPLSQFQPPLERKPFTVNFLVDCGEGVQRGNMPVEDGEFLGVVQGNDRQKILNGACAIVRMGRGEEVNSLLSLRKHSVDRLVVFKRQMGWGVDILQLLRSGQRLSFVASSWSQIQSLIRVWQSQMVQSLGEYLLEESIDNLFYSIIISQSSYWITFQRKKSFPYIKNLLKRLISIEITQDTFQQLLTKITLRQYLNLGKEQQDSIKKIRSCIREMDRQRQDRIVKKMEQKIQVKIQVVEERRDIIDKFSQNQGQIQYYQSKLKEGNVKIYQDGKSPAQELQMFYFYQNQASDLTSEGQRINKPAEWRNLGRKFRSKSEDATYLPSGSEDDELFDKY